MWWKNHFVALLQTSNEVMYDDPYNNKKLPLIWRVVVLGCISDNIFLAILIKLANNNTNAKSTVVSV